MASSDNFGHLVRRKGPNSSRVQSDRVAGICPGGFLWKENMVKKKKKKKNEEKKRKNNYADCAFAFDILGVEEELEEEEKKKKIVFGKRRRISKINK